MSVVPPDLCFCIHASLGLTQFCIKPLTRCALKVCFDHVGLRAGEQNEFMGNLCCPALLDQSKKKTRVIYFATFSCVCDFAGQLRRFSTCSCTQNACIAYYIFFVIPLCSGVLLLFTFCIQVFKGIKNGVQEVAVKVLINSDEIQVQMFQEVRPLPSKLQL